MESSAPNAAERTIKRILESIRETRQQPTEQPKEQSHESWTNSQKIRDGNSAVYTAVLHCTIHLV